MKAIISDIHGNLDALSAVWEDIKKKGADTICCLGDIVGYGPEPEACIDFVMEQSEFCLMGNHDYALLHGPIGFNPIAADLIRTTREIMLSHLSDQGSTDCFEPEYFPCACQNRRPRCLLLKHSPSSRWKYMENLKASRTEGDTLYVHGSPLDPTFEYVFPDSISSGWAPQRLQEMFQQAPGLTFCGHSHRVFMIDSDLACGYPEPDGSVHWLSHDKQYIVNPGSVGQPRDGDPRASYLLYDPEQHSVEWRRVEYDIEAAKRKIDKMCGEDNWCGVRLQMGR